MSRYRISRPTRMAAFFVIALTLCVAASPVHVFGQSTAMVIGYVVDESGNKIYNVKVSVCSPGGAFVTSAYTSYSGSFVISLEDGKDYVLYFSKDKYAEVTRSVSLRFMEQVVNLGNIALGRVRLSSSIVSLVANPGYKLLLPFIANNMGDESRIVEFSISNPKGWSSRILDQSGSEIRKVGLTSGATLNLQLEVMIPLSSTGYNSLTLTTVGNANSTLQFMIDVQPSDRSILSCQFPGKSAVPGNAVRFQVRLNNPFGVEKRFKILIDSVPSNWAASVKSAAGDYVTELILASNEFVDLVVEVESPDAARVGEEHGLLVRAESYDGSITGSLPLSIALRSTAKVEEEIKITSKFPEVTVQAGKIVQYPITIINSGTVDRLLSLSVDPPGDWKVVFKSGVLEVATLYMEAGTSESLIIEATPPSTVSIGTYTIPVRVTSPGIYTEISLKSTIAGSYGLSLAPSTLLTSVTAASSLTLTARTTNTGYTSVTGLSLSVSVPSGWDASVTPVRVESLRPQESYTFTVVVKTTADTVAGDYLITLTGSADQVKSDSVQVRITATVPTSWGLIGVGIAAAMVIALVFAFMKFRRR